MGNKTELLDKIFSDGLKQESEKTNKSLYLEEEEGKRSKVKGTDSKEKRGFNKQLKEPLSPAKGEPSEAAGLFDAVSDAQAPESSLSLMEDSSLKGGSKNPEKAPLKPAPKKNSPPLKEPKTLNYKVKEASAPQLQISRSQFGTVRDSGGSPLQFNLIQSESLRLAQSKIANLEEEMESLRRDNEKLVAAGEVLEERMDQLKVENEDFRREREENMEAFDGEKEILLSTLEEGRKKTAHLEKIKKQLENRLSRDLQSIRARENSLENKIEIMKLEHGVLQKEKDKMIIDLQRSLYKVKDSLKVSQKRNQELQEQLNHIRENLRKTVSVLRATVNNLEGFRQKREDTTSVKKAS